MQAIHDNLLELPDFCGYQCDGCEAELSLDDTAPEVKVIYHLLNSNYSIDLCRDCYVKLPDLLKKRDSSYRMCEICFQYISPIEPECWGLENSCFDSCTACLPRIKDAFFPITRELLHVGNKEVIYTEREYMYRCIEPDQQLAIPVAIQDRITDERNQNYLENYLDFLVRPPSFDWNAAEWRMISDLDKVPSYPASCGFAVRCILDHHQVASVVMDDHGRVAMNPVFESVEDFLETERKWLDTRPSEEERQKAIEEVAKSFRDSYSCEDPLLINATDSFAVYIRIHRGLSMYYG